MQHNCPHCGAALHESAAFCPHCAKSVNERRVAKTPRPLQKTFLRIGAVLLACALVLLCVYGYSKPLVYDGYGEVIYEDKDGKYQLIFGYSNDRYQPVPELHTKGELEEDYRMPVRLFVNHVDSGADAGQLFLHKVENVTAEFVQPEDSPSPMQCTEPAPYVEYAPDAALLTSVTFTGRSGAAELVWTFEMKNGDKIYLRQSHVIEPIETINFYPGDVPMETIEELQALVDEIAETVGPNEVVNIFLPPVTYNGQLVMESRPVNLYGSKEGQARTTFTNTIRVAAKNSHIFYFRDMDFVGNGGVGISASTQLHIIGCRFTGWKTAVLAYGYAWVNIAESSFEENEVGFHFNSAGGSVSHTIFNDNRFERNGTGVLLESVPSEVTMNFIRSVFSENGKDIDNLCNQSIDISESVFE